MPSRGVHWSDRLFVRLSVTFVYSVEMCKHIVEIFSLSDSHSILDLAYQTLWQHSNADPLTGASNARGVGKNRYSR